MAYSARATNDLVDNQYQEFRNLPNGVAVANFSEGVSFSNITTLTTTTLKTGQGTLCAIMINTKGGTGNTVTVYDSATASGTKICTIDTTSSLTYLPYNAAFANGLTIVTATGTPADITVMYL